MLTVGEKTGAVTFRSPLKSRLHLCYRQFRTLSPRPTIYTADNRAALLPLLAKPSSRSIEQFHRETFLEVCLLCDWRSDRCSKSRSNRCKTLTPATATNLTTPLPNWLMPLPCAELWIPMQCIEVTEFCHLCLICFAYNSQLTITVGLRISYSKFVFVLTLFLSTVGRLKNSNHWLHNKKSGNFMKN